MWCALISLGFLFLAGIVITRDTSLPPGIGGEIVTSSDLKDD
jgi:hypothetical protein